MTGHGNEAGDADRVCRRSGLGGAILLFALLSFLPFASLAQAGVKAKIGEFGTPSGSGKGQLESPSGIAVNRSGAGGVIAGDVYVVDGGDLDIAPPGNNRIEEFSAAGAFVRAWGIDVVASGPDDKGSGVFEICLPADECKAGTPSEAAGGMSKPQGIAIDQTTGTVYVIDANFNKRVDVYSAKGEFEGAFGWHVNAGAPDEKLQFCTTTTTCQKGTGGGGAGQLPPTSPRSLPAVDPDTGHLYVPEAGTGGEGNFRVEEFAPTFSGAEEVTGIAFVKAIGWDVVASGPDQADETQLIRVRAGAGKFKLRYQTESTELDYNATATEMAGALNGLGTLAGDGFTATVSGGPGDPGATNPYEVTFHSSPKGKNATQLVGTSISLSGGIGESSVKVETYNEGGAGLESCVAAHPEDVCKAGVETPNTGAANHLGQFSNGNPTSVAVDGNGTLYAVNQSSNFTVAPSRVLRFDFPAPGEVKAAEFAPKQLKQESGTPSAVNPTDVAIDSESGNVVVAKKEGVEHFKILEFDSAEHLLFESPPGAGLAVERSGGLAVGNAERLYLSDHENSAGTDKGRGIILGPPGPPAVCCIGVSEVGTTTATFEGTVTPLTGFPTGYHFEYSRDGADWTPLPKADVAIGDGTAGGTSSTCPTPPAAVCEVRQEAFGLESNADYMVRLVASDGNTATSGAVAFKTAAAAPAVSGEVAMQVARTTADLSGFVNPNNQPTTYHFEWGDQAEFEAGEYGHEEPEAPAGTGGEAVEVLAPLSGLEEGTAYHFRIVATNATGETKGPDQEFTTLDAFGLPNGRAPEQVSPTDKRPVGMVGQLLEGQIRYQAASGGNSAIYPLLNGLADATAGGNVEYLGGREGMSWVSTQLTPPALVSPIAIGKGGDSTGQVMYASADLSCQLIESPEPLGEITPELEDDVAKGISNLYRRNADASYTLLSPQPLNFETSGNYHVDWASENCHQILFDTRYRLLPGAPASGNGLYEWDSGTLRLVGIHPDGSPAPDAVAGLGEVLNAPGDGLNYTNVNSISADGSKAFFTAKSNDGPDEGREAIFMRRNGTETLDISQSQTATVDKGPRYAMASADGSKVFFVANYGLATNGTSVGAADCNSGGATGGDGTGCDLYEYDTTTGILIDLSVGSADAKGASVVGMLDASTDGSRAYFAARGQLVPDKGKTEAQNLAGNGTYNVYLSEEGALSYVGEISAADANGNALSGSDLTFRFGHWVADATPNGGHLLFVSKADVTGYESGGATEVYLYTADTGETVCVSCRDDGQDSLADEIWTPLKQVTQENFPVATDVQNRARAISDDGRHIFFTMPDVLVAGAKPGTHNIYEWSAGQLYLLLAGEGGIRDFTEYEDSSSSGADVFLVTKAKLVPQDFDSTTDLYDLRAPHVPGEMVGPPSIVPAPVPCEPLGGECQGPPTPQPGASQPPGSEAASSAGNPAPEPPKKRRKKHRHKRRHHKKHHSRRAGR